MNTSTRRGIRIRRVGFTRDRLIVDLADGRSVSVPLSWYPRLEAASPAERADWELCAGGHGVHWPAIDEDLSSEGILAGAPAPRAPTTLGG